jgi:hypothetical protein
LKGPRSAHPESGLLRLDRECVLLRQSGGIPASKDRSPGTPAGIRGRRANKSVNQRTVKLCRPIRLQKEGKCRRASLQTEASSEKLQKSPVAGVRKTAKGPAGAVPKVRKTAQNWSFFAPILILFTRVRRGDVYTLRVHSCRLMGGFGLGSQIRA